MKRPSTPRLVAHDYPKSIDTCSSTYMPILHGLGLMLFGDVYRDCGNCAIRWNFSIKNPTDNFCQFKILSVLNESGVYQSTNLRNDLSFSSSAMQKSLDMPRFMALKYCFFGSDRLPAKDLKPQAIHCSLPQRYKSAHDTMMLMKNVNELMEKAHLDARAHRRSLYISQWF